MATVQDNLNDAAMRNTVYLLRYARTVYTQHSNLIDRAVNDLIYQSSIRAPADNSFTKARLDAILKSISGISTELFNALQSSMTGELKDLAAYESQFQVTSIQQAYPIELKTTTVTPAQIHAASMSRPFQGKILRDWYKDQSYAIQRQYQAAIRLGFVEGETLGQITGRLRDVGGLHKRQTEALVRTAVNHMAQVATNKTTQANIDLFKGEVWVATLDGRTTPVCQARDGKTYKIGKGPYPPAHFGCRSRRVPVTKSWKELGFDDLDEFDPLNKRPFVADTRRVADIPKKQRRDIIGQTTAASYNDWLKTQNRSFVEDVLGKNRAALYLDGDLTLDKFVDRTGSSYTLKELGKRESAAFSKAGI
jgi:SPP1 gp7 family putative phage head morphogenesis protein